MIGIDDLRDEDESGHGGSFGAPLRVAELRCAHTLAEMTGRLVYVANARLPTEKAHGHAIVKMCEAYAGAGLDVELWHPHRQQDPRIAGRTVFEYYGAAPLFRVRTLANVDVIAVEARFPRSVFPWVMGVHDLAWAATVAARLLTSRPRPVCHTRDVAVAWWTTAMHIPTILEVHDPPAGQRRVLLRRIARSRHLHGVVALTEAARDALASMGVDPEEILVRGSGVDLAGYAELPSPAACRRAASLPDDRVVVGYVGRFSALGEEKGLLTAVRAVGAMRHARGDAPLLVCVGGPMDHVDRYVAEGIAAGARAGDFRFVDHVPSTEVPQWIRACHLGVIPSPRQDHFTKFSSPMKLFEFMACSVPVVASDLPALRETLGHDRNGWLVPPDSVDGLARGLARLVDDAALRERLATTARADVESHTWARRADAILARFGASLDGYEGSEPL
jgi:glycosyltransferase involved in cell wall biosynthesis